MRSACDMSLDQLQFRCTTHTKNCQTRTSSVYIHAMTMSHDLGERKFVHGLSRCGWLLRSAVMWIKSSIRGHVRLVLACVANGPEIAGAFERSRRNDCMLRIVCQRAIPWRKCTILFASWCGSDDESCRHRWVGASLTRQLFNRKCMSDKERICLLSTD